MEVDEDDELAQIKARYAADSHRRAAEVYRWRNEDLEREKARKRMAARRERLRATDNEWEVYRERCKASDRKYRARNSAKIATKAKLRRIEASIEKHGFAKSNELYNQREDARRGKKEYIAKTLQNSHSSRKRAV